MLSNSGCYLAHLADGQLRLLRARRSIESILADPATQPELRERLERVEAARAFARDLGLEVDDQYTSYAEWPGDRIVTTVVATPPGSVEARGYRFPIVGSVPYRGYFEEAKANAEAERLRADGFDVCVVPVPAYSTLGWMADPVTGPMLRLSDAQLVETVIHELVHATVFAESAADFNEGIASFVGQEARILFFASTEGAGSAERQRQLVLERRAIDAITLDFRQAVADLYASAQPDAIPESERAALEARARESLAALESSSRDAADFAARARLNDACLALLGTYSADLPRYAEALDRLGGDLRKLIEAAREAVENEDPRAALLGTP